MKEAWFYLYPRQFDWAFSPLRSKDDVLRLLMNTVKYFGSYKYVDEDEEPVARVGLHVNKMSRLFFISEKKSFSIVFPFTVQVSGDDDFVFRTRHGVEVDSKFSSAVLACLRDRQLISFSNVYEFVDAVEEVEQGDDFNLWQGLNELMLFEDGYIRFDHDAVNESGDRHPLFHFDLFYSSKSTFKLGVRNMIDENGFRYLLDITTDCVFLEPFG